MKLKSVTGFVLLLSFLVVACEDKIPIKEFTKAKEAIELAKSVSAEEYSPEEYKAANEQLVKAHEVLIRDEKPDDSVKNSEESYKKAMEAYNKSAVLFAADGLKMADNAISEADVVYAEKLSPDLYAKAKESYSAANEKFEAKDYIASNALSVEAYNYAVKAKDESNDNKYQLQVKIDEVNAIITKIEQYDYEEYAPAEFNIAKSKTADAQKSYSEGKLKDGFDYIETAKINADQAYKMTMEGVTARKLAEAEEVVKDAENSKGASIAVEDLAASKEALNNAKSLKESGSYEESITYSNEAIRLGNNVIEEGNKTSVATGDGGKGKDGKGTGTKVNKGFVSEDENYYYYKVKTWEKYQECLSRIAEQYYKNAKAWKRIHRANQGRIKNPDLIRPGWVIRIPKVK